jgi:predicted phage tail protein
MSADYVRSVFLHGPIGDRFGHEHKLAVGSPGEAMRALTTQHPGLTQALAEGEWRCIRGDVETGLQFGIDELSFRLGKAPLHIVPVIQGEAKGLGKILGGLALAIGGFLIGGPAGSALAWATRAAQGIGISLALRGAAALFTSTPPVSNDRSGVADSSWVFNTQENSTEQGVCVPVVIGEFRCGSRTVATSIKVEAA